MPDDRVEIEDPGIQPVVSPSGRGVLQKLSSVSDRVVQRLKKLTYYSQHAYRLLRRTVTFEWGLVGTAIALGIITLGFVSGAVRIEAPGTLPEAFLGTSVTILATVLAIVVSVATLGVQVVAESFAPTVAREYSRLLRNWPTAVLYGLYSLGILYDLWGLLPYGSNAFGMPNSPFLAYSYVLTGICFVYLALYLGWVLTAVSSERLIQRFAAKIDSHFIGELKGYETSRYRLEDLPLEQNPLSIVEQLVYRAIERGERRVAYSALLEAYHPVVQFIRAENQTNVESFFAASLTRCAMRALASSNEEIVEDIVIVATEMASELRERGVSDPAYIGFYGFSDAIQRIGRESLQRGFPSAAAETFRSIVRVADAEIQYTIPKDDTFADIESKEVIGEAEFARRVDQQIIWDEFTYGRLRYLTELGKEAAKRGFEDLVGKATYAMSHLAQKIAELGFRDRVRSWPYAAYLASIVAVESSAIESGLEPITFSQLDVLWRLPGEYGKAAMRASIKVFSKATDLGVEPPLVAWRLGYLGRVAADARFQDMAEETGSELLRLAEKVRGVESAAKAPALEGIEKETKSVQAWLAKQSPPIQSEKLEENLKAISQMVR